MKWGLTTAFRAAGVVVNMADLQRGVAVDLAVTYMGNPAAIPDDRRGVGREENSHFADAVSDCSAARR